MSTPDTAAQWTALALLADHEKRLGRPLEPGDAGVYTSTWADNHTVGIQYRTAEALARRGLVTIEGAPMPDEASDLFLTDAGRSLVSGPPGRAVVTMPDTDARCSRHPARLGSYGIVSHYLDSGYWRDTVRADQVLDAICSECRMELIRWLTTPVSGDEPAANGEPIGPVTAARVQDRST